MAIARMIDGKIYIEITNDSLKSYIRNHNGYKFVFSTLMGSLCERLNLNTSKDDSDSLITKIMIEVVSGLIESGAKGIVKCQPQDIEQAIDCLTLTPLAYNPLTNEMKAEMLSRLGKKKNG